MKDKTVLVTGASNGIGEITARALAAMGADTFIVGRNLEKTAAVAEDIRKQTGNPRIETLIADLSSMSEVRKLAAEFLSRRSRLDVLVNNAGSVFTQRHESVDGLEMTFALNHMNYFLLTNLLLDTLKASAPARIVNVSSMAHNGARINFDDLQHRSSFSGWSAYGQSKLDNLYFTYELARRLEGTGVTANALHPGFVASGFGRNNPGLFGKLISLSQVIAISPEKGAETSIYLASSPEVEGVTGKYFIKKKAARSSTESYNVEAARRLWQVSLELAGLPVTV